MSLCTWERVNGSSSSADRSIAKNSSLDIDRMSSLWLLFVSEPTGSRELIPFKSLAVHKESFDGEILFRLKCNVPLFEIITENFK